jgi:hypothetical protein
LPLQAFLFFKGPDRQGRFFLAKKFLPLISDFLLQFLFLNISQAGPQHKLQDGFSWSLHAMICKRNEQFRGPWADAEI